MTRSIYSLLAMAVCFFSALSLHAQFSVSGQIRTRTEFRDGQGSPLTRDAPSALFTSQRTRLNLGYGGHRFMIYAALQDVRVWGQDASSINRITRETYDGLMLHEAWGEFSLLDTGTVSATLTLRIGRQELSYDDARLLGNLDWLQQARRHDAAVLKFQRSYWTAHAGAAFNQNGEAKTGTVYNGMPIGYPASTGGMGAMYKSMQFVYVARKLSFGNASLLALKDDFSRFSFDVTDSLQSTPVFNNRVWSRMTAGGNLSGKLTRTLSFAASAFYQGGEYRNGTDLNEYLLSASLMLAVTPKFSAGPGIDVTSGNNGADPSKKFQRFDPLYGTPHKFWGFMDYFYVADGFGPNGLVDYYLKTRLTAKENLVLATDLHHFTLPEPVPSETGSKMKKSLGTEIDLVVNYSMTRAVNIEGGFSAMFATETLTSPRVKNVTRASDISTWAYLMISIKPEFITLHQSNSYEKL